MAIIILIVLGIVQGLAEFLPVSSSGHLALLENLFHLSESQRLSYTAFLHLGTTLALLFYFRKKVYDVIVNSFNHSGQNEQKQSIKLILFIIIGTIPAGIIGYLAKDKIDLVFQTPIYSAVFLLITGVILFLTKFAQEKNSNLSYKDAILIGFAQAIALLPGISRSGATISIALFIGLTTASAFEFSFLLSIPAVIGANILLLKNISSHLTLLNLILSIAVPFIIGILALEILKKIVIRKKLYYFAYYCWAIGLLAILLILI
jgi:undecaprenyl-diphosphatase